MADDHVIKPDNLVVRPLTTVQARERMKVKQENIKKAKEAKEKENK